MLENRLSENNILVGEIQDQVIDLSKKEQEKVVEPQKEDVVVLPDDAMKVLSKVTVKGVTADIDENIKAENIKLGVNILGIEGNVAPDKPDQEKTIYPSEEEQIVVADNGFELAKVIAKPVETESFEIEPSTSEQIVKASDGKYIKEVKVGAIEDLETEISEQETLLVELESQVNELKDISDETLNINENGEYDVKDYGKVVVSVGVGKEIILTLPFEAIPTTEIYTFQPNENTILVGSNANIGVWVYKINSDTWIHSWESGQFYKYFQIVGNKCLIGASSSNGNPILSYDFKDDTIVSLYKNSAEWKYFKPVGNNCLISNGYSNGSLLLYEGDTNTITLLFSNVGLHYFKIIKNKCLVHGSSGVYLYDILTKNIVKISDIQCYSTIYEEIGNDYLMGGTGYDSVGVFLYDSVNETIDHIYTEGRGWGYFHKNRNCDVCLIGAVNGSSYGLGLLLYNSTTKTIELVHQEEHGWITFHDVGDDCLISGAGTGILLYNHIEGSVNKIYAEGKSWNIGIEVDNNCIINSTSSSYKGILLYNSENKTITKEYDSGYNYQRFQIIGNDCLLGSQSSYGLIYYNSTTKSITNIATNYSLCFINFQIIDEKCLCGLMGDYGLFVFNTSDTSVKRLLNKGYYNVFEVDGNNCYVGFENKTTNPRVLYYKSDDDSLTLAKYYIGEV